MIQEQLRMQMLAGIITESEYKAKLDEKYGENYDLEVGDSFTVEYMPEEEGCTPRGYEDVKVGDKLTLTKRRSNIQSILFDTNWPQANPNDGTTYGLTIDDLDMFRGKKKCYGHGSFFK
jgi:hypothetical protein